MYEKRDAAFKEWQDEPEVFSILVDEKDQFLTMTTVELVYEIALKAFNAGWKARKELDLETAIGIREEYVVIHD